MVQVPSYIYLEVTAALLQQLVNADQYEYDWDKKVYFKAENDRMEIRTADTDTLLAVTKEQFKALEQEQDNGNPDEA
jgi:hypothetical protein